MIGTIGTAAKRRKPVARSICITVPSVCALISGGTSRSSFVHVGASQETTLLEREHPDGLGTSRETTNDSQALF